QQALRAAESDQDLADQLLGLAQDQRKAGIASGVDVARAQTAVAQSRFALAQVKAGLTSAWITLKRAISAPQDSGLVLSDARDFSDQELTLARDRFAHGVGSNVDVIEAQTSLSRARANYVDALAAFHVARANLAAALGESGKFHLTSAAPMAARLQDAGASP